MENKASADIALDTARIPVEFLCGSRDRVRCPAGSQVDTIFYCSLQGPMSLHCTKVGETLTANAGDYYTEGPEGKYFAAPRNITADLIAQGTDPLQVMVDFCRGHGLEVFYSMRMNDTHDATDNEGRGERVIP